MEQNFFNRKFFGVLFCAAVLSLATVAVSEENEEAEPPIDGVNALITAVWSAQPAIRRATLQALVDRGKPDVVPALIQTLRFVPDHAAINAALVAITGEASGKSWFDWMLWLQDHDEIEPFAGFDRYKADVMALIDEDFVLFLYPGVAHEIRLVEIVWGGVRKDGIPALVNPRHVVGSEADYLEDDELVFGVEIEGDARAYPLRILDWHEMFNDVVGGVPVALAYCTLCGSGILYETQLARWPEPVVFGSSGFLFRSNKLMYDQRTHSLWNQFTGRPVVGPLTGSGIELKVRPVVITKWKYWLADHPDTKVLSLDTGFDRDYTPGKPYWEYFSSPDLMFPARVADQRLEAKSYVFTLRTGVVDKAWPLSLFDGGRVVNDRVGDRRVVLIGDTASRTVRAYEGGSHDFEKRGETMDRVSSDAGVWTVAEEALRGPEGQRLPRLPGHIAYWFAWRGFNQEGPVGLP